jgi:dolichyl-phosphate-mannose--protein O-mannosyl transferase
LLSRPVYYYAQGELGIDAWTGQSLVAQIYNIGNPWIWWTALLALLALPYFIFWRRSFPATLITLGFLTQYLPWSQIHRVTFLYHMFAGSLFMILALAFVLTKIYEHRAGVGRAFAISHLALALLAFCYFYPIWTGIPLGNSALNAGPGTPVWGAKAALNHCTPNVTPQQPQLWCWP